MNCRKRYHWDETGRTTLRCAMDQMCRGITWNSSGGHYRRRRCFPEKCFGWTCSKESVYINVLSVDLNVSGLAMLATGGMSDGWWKTLVVKTEHMWTGHFFMHILLSFIVGINWFWSLMDFWFSGRGERRTHRMHSMQTTWWATHCIFNDLNKTGN